VSSEYRNSVYFCRGGGSLGSGSGGRWWREFRCCGEGSGLDGSGLEGRGKGRTFASFLIARGQMSDFLKILPWSRFLGVAWS